MDKKTRAWFIAERARALATVYLTRRDDLIVREAKGDRGLDFVVTIAHDDEPADRMFGVLLRATMAPVTEDHANKVLKPTMASFGRFDNLPYPVCLFYFTMRNDHGYYTWLLEPVVTEAGKPKLIHHTEPECEHLDNESLGRIVSKVDQWYEALLTELRT